MKQCLTVLEEIQPASYKDWEKACYDDMHAAGGVCLSIDMDMALSRCIDQGYVVDEGKVGDGAKGGYSYECRDARSKGPFVLAAPLPELLEKLDAVATERHAEQEKEEAERKHELREWINTVPEATLRALLLEIADDDAYTTDGSTHSEDLGYILQRHDESDPTWDQVRLTLKKLEAAESK